MRRVVQTLSWISLVVLMAPPVLFIAGKMTLDTVKLVMLIATVAWFATTPFWMGKKEDA